MKSGIKIHSLNYIFRKKFTLSWLLIGMLSLVTAGCSNQQVLSEQSALQTFPAVASLKEQISQADTSNIALLAPKQYESVTVLFDRAMKLAQANNPQADEFAQRGLAAMTSAKEKAARADDTFEEVMRARQRAIQAGAPQYNPEAFDKAEKSFVGLTTLFESGGESKAKAGRADAMKIYSDVELETLKGSTIDRAKEAIAKAKKMDVDDYAPKTLQLAIGEMELATNVLDADRSSTVKAERHSQTALYHARRATEITEIIKNFRASDYENEDIVLWYQEQLSRAVAPVNPALSFDIPNKEVVKGVAAELGDLSTDYATASKELAETKMAKDEAIKALTEEKNMAITALTTEKESALQKTKAESEQERLKNEAIAARFNNIQTMFGQSEADVYRQVDNVLIRAHGFKFASGKSDIDAENFSLLNRIISAIAEFPKSQVRVSGHTDSQGDVNNNQNLSQDRADKVAKFLIEVGNIPSNRIVATGFGEEKPVASNETASGRAANRRVEILIENSAGL